MAVGPVQLIVLGFDQPEFMRSACHSRRSRYALARGGTGEGTTPHKSHVSHTSHRMVKPDPLAMRGVNGLGWDRTSVPRVKRVHRETRLCPDMLGRLNHAS